MLARLGSVASLFLTASRSVRLRASSQAVLALLLSLSPPVRDLTALLFLVGITLTEAVYQVEIFHRCLVATPGLQTVIMFPVAKQWIGYHAINLSN